jgi:hypothetical protein
MEIAEADKDAECPDAKGADGFRYGILSLTPNDDERLDIGSKWPERFSFSVLVNVKPDSFREMGVDGIFGKLVEFGEIAVCGGLDA